MDKLEILTILCYNVKTEYLFNRLPVLMDEKKGENYVNFLSLRVKP